LSSLKKIVFALVFCFLVLAVSAVEPKPLKKTVSVDFDLTITPLLTTTVEEIEPAANLFNAKTCAQASLYSVTLTNNGDDVLVYSGTFLEVRFKDLKRTKVYSVDSFSLLDGEVHHSYNLKPASDTRTINCFNRPGGALPAGVYAEKTVVIGSRKTVEYYDVSGRRLLGGAASVLEKAFKTPAPNCFYSSSGDEDAWKVWRSGEINNLIIPLNSDDAEYFLGQPWVLEDNAKIIVSCARLGLNEEASIIVSSNEFEGSGVFSFCLDDSVKIGGLVFEVTDFGADRIFLKEKTFGELPPLLISKPDYSFDSVSISLKSVKHVGNKAQNPFQARIEFRSPESESDFPPLENQDNYGSQMPGELENKENPGIPENQQNQENQGTQNPPSPAVQQSVAAANFVQGIELVCRKNVTSEFRLVFPFSSPCPPGFNAENTQNYGGWLVFYRSALCVKEYRVCGAAPSCDEGDEALWRDACNILA